MDAESRGDDSRSSTSTRLHGGGTEEKGRCLQKRRKKTAAGRGVRLTSPNYARILVDRTAACFAAWYEFFPRSAEGRGDKGSTFRDCLTRIDDAKAMGFDVIYFPPIHPVGVTARKGRNNSR